MTVQPSTPLRRNLIGGEWRTSISGQISERRSPMRPAEIVARYPCSDSEDVDAAVTSAAQAAQAWADSPPYARAEILRRAADLLDQSAEDVAQTMTAEMGKPIREARAEASRVPAILRFYAGEALRDFGGVYHQMSTRNLVHTHRRPVGVVGLLTPWNFPAAIPTFKLAPALVFGNAVVLKLAEQAPAAALFVAQALTDAGLPPGVLNVLVGGRSAGAALVTDQRVQAISFTGSTAVGREIAANAARRGARVQLELGGQNPLVVLGDADVAAATEAAFAGAFWSAGQRCTATRRIIVESAIYDAFRESFVARVKSARVGDPDDPQVEVGPLVDEASMLRIIGAIADAKAAGATLVTGGNRVDDTALLLAPAVFENADHRSNLACEEIFGPVTSLYRVDTLDEALILANNTEYGLSAAVFTRDVNAVARFTREVRAGIIRINGPTAGSDVHVPSGGLKDSGYGPQEQGRAASEFFTESVTIYH